MRFGLRTSSLAIAATAVLSLALPVGASATKVGRTAIAEPASECFPPKGNKYASTSCQVFPVNSLEIIGVASRI